jgi:ABC-type glycerol-3-phosphate transport system substrate-binding protein
MNTSTIKRFTDPTLLCIMLLVCLIPASICAQYGEDSERLLLGFTRAESYENYLSVHKEAPRPELTITTDAVPCRATDESGVSRHDAYEGSATVVLWEESDGSISWRVTVEHAGMYVLGLRYFAVESSNVGIELELRIDGTTPFDGARRLTLNKLWKDESGVVSDQRGNELRSRKIPVPTWQFGTFRDPEGKHDDPYRFFFESGSHVITFIGAKTGFAIDYLELFNYARAPDYKEVAAAYRRNGNGNIKGQRIRIQAEMPFRRSDPIVHPEYDSSGPGTDFSHPTKIRMNTLGGYNWQYPAQSVSWKFEVPKAGLYKIGIRVLQNFRQGIFTSRRIYIDGEVPFDELNRIEFPYADDWYIKPVGGDDPYLFHLAAGEHEISMEVVSGSVAQTLRTVEDAVYRLNYAYRRIIMVTGTQPDQYRDYFLEQEIPGLMDNFAIVSTNLSAEKSRIEEITGLRGGTTAPMEQMVLQLDSFKEKPHTIPQRLASFKSNVSSLSGTMLTLKYQPLQIDYLVILSPEEEYPRPRARLLKRLWFKIAAFIGSFKEDYNAVGNIYSDREALEVWIGRGRDQVQLMKQIIDNDFVAKTGIPVNVKLIGQISGGARQAEPGRGPLIQAALAGLAPDVAMFVPWNEPLNLAARGALVDLSRYENFDGVRNRFIAQALEPFEHLGGYYALPVTQQFPMMFYRKDIFSELGIAPPVTWNEFYGIVPVLQRYNMRIGIPNITVQAAATGQAVNSIFQMLLYQRGGSMFNADKSRTNFDEAAALEAFKQWTGFYTQYSFPLVFQFYTEFRTGEMPLAIENYTTYNQLVVGAPEIHNQWEMVPVPGFERQDGSINNSVPAAGDTIVIFSESDRTDEAWEFLKWATSAEVQTEFGRSIEALIGPAGRYTTANLEAIGSLPWSKREYQLIMSQFEHAFCVPVIPASYYVARNLTYAFRNVTYHWENPREVFYENNNEINEEITRKRIELGIGTP